MKCPQLSKPEATARGKQYPIMTMWKKFVEIFANLYKKKKIMYM